MRRLLFACLGLTLTLAMPMALPTPAQAVTVNLTIGTSLNNGRFLIYRAWRGGSRFEIAVSAHNGRVVDVRRIRR